MSRLCFVPAIMDPVTSFFLNSLMFSDFFTKRIPLLSSFNTAIREVANNTYFHQTCPQRGGGSTFYPQKNNRCFFVVKKHPHQGFVIVKIICFRSNGIYLCKIKVHGKILRHAHCGSSGIVQCTFPKLAIQEVLPKLYIL